MTPTTGGSSKENTITSRLVESLHHEGLGSADFEQHFPVLRGRPRKPDAAFAFGGKTFLVSAKLGVDKENEARESAKEYQRLIGVTTVLGDVFAVVYPKARGENWHVWSVANLRHEELSWTRKSLPEVARLLALVARGELDRVASEADPIETAAARVLGQAVREIATALRGVSNERLKAIFGGRDFFDSVLSFELRTEEERTEALRTAAGYLLVNQALFYEILSTEVPGEYSPISLADATDPDLVRTRYFDRVLHRDYKPIFEVDVNKCLSGESGSNGLLKVINTVRSITSSLGHRREILGNVFHELIPLPFRKPLGAYFTNPLAAEVLARLAVRAPTDLVLDPACGSGTLLAAAYRRKKQLYDTGPPPNMHKQFVEKDLTGMDVMAFVAHLAAVHLALQEPLADTDVVRIGVADSIRTGLGSEIAAAARTIRDGFRQRRLSSMEPTGVAPLPPEAAVTAGAVEVSDDSPSQPFPLDQVDLVITNPPFTSCNNMAVRYRREVELAFSGSGRYKDCVGGRWSFQVPFMLLADKFLKPGARLAAVLPVTTFSGKYFGPWLKFLVSNYTVRYIVAGVHGCAFSDDTQLTEVLLVADKVPPPPNQKLALLGLYRGPHRWSKDDAERVRSALEDLSRGHPAPTNALTSSAFVNQTEILPKNAGLPRLVANLSHGFAVATRKLEVLLRNAAVASAKEVLKRNNWQLYIGKAFRVFRDSPAETGHGLRAYGGEAILFSSSPERARKAQDRFVIEGRSSRRVRITDRKSPDRHFEVPAGETVGYIRRFAGLDLLKADESVDLAIRRYCPAAEELLRYVYPSDWQDKARTMRRDWELKVTSDQSRLLLFYKGDWVTSGTQLFAVRTSRPTFVAGDVWGVRGTKEDDEKVLALWMNSTPYILSMLGPRTMTRGSYGRLDKNVIERLPLLDPRRLSNSERRKLVTLFNHLAELQWPSLAEQFQSNSRLRTEVDDVIIEALGATPDDARVLGNLLREAVAAKLEGLRDSTHSRAH